MQDLKKYRKLIRLAGFIALSIFVHPALAQTSACAKQEPTLCATLRNLPPLIAGQALTFDVELTHATSDLKVELVWDSEAEELRIVSVPEKIIPLTSTTYTVKRIITVFDGQWSLDLYPKIQNQTFLIQIPLEILPDPKP